MKILIMGLPGSGKTTLASKLVPLLNAKWINNDEARKAANDWDFSEEGRIRQAKRMADLAEKISQVPNQGLVEITGVLFIIGFGIKAGVFPLYFWLPASYHTPPFAVSAIFGGLLTKVGVYALLRVFTLIFHGDDFINTLLIVIAIFTLISGGVGALVQNNIRKIFSYLIICHIGYMIAGLGMFTEIAIAGAIFYLIHDIVVKTNLFMSSMTQ